MPHRVLLGAALAAALSTPAAAGGFAPAVVEPTVVVAEPTAPRSAANVVVPLAILAVLVAVAASRDGDDDGDDAGASDPVAEEPPCDEPVVTVGH